VHNDRQKKYFDNSLDYDKIRMQERVDLQVKFVALQKIGKVTGD